MGQAQQYRLPISEAPPHTHTPHTHTQNHTHLFLLENLRRLLIGDAFQKLVVRILRGGQRAKVEIRDAFGVRAIATWVKGEGVRREENEDNDERAYERENA